MKKNVSRLDPHLLMLVKVQVVQHQSKILKLEKNFLQLSLLNEKKLNLIDQNLELQEWLFLVEEECRVEIILN